MAVVRSSIKTLFEEQKLALIPGEDVVTKLLEIQKHNRNCKDRFYDRIRYTEVRYTSVYFDVQQPSSYLRIVI
jgi:hypothetical protein